MISFRVSAEHSDVLIVEICAADCTCLDLNCVVRRGRAVAARDKRRGRRRSRIHKYPVADRASCRSLCRTAEGLINRSAGELQRIVPCETVCRCAVRQSAVDSPAAGIRNGSARDCKRIILNGISLLGTTAPNDVVCGSFVILCRIIAEAVARRGDFRIVRILVDGQLIVAVRSPQLFRMIVCCAEIELVVAAGTHQRPCRFIGARSAARAVFDLELRPVERRRRYRRGAVVQRQHGVSAGFDRVQRKGDDVELLNGLGRRCAADIELVVRSGSLIAARDHAADGDACPLDVDGVVRGDACTVGFAAVDVTCDMTAAQGHSVVRRVARRRLGIAAVDIADRLGRADGALNIDRVVGRMRRRRRRIGHRAVDVIQTAGRQRLDRHGVLRGRIAAARIAAVDIAVRRARRRGVKYDVGPLYLVVDGKDIRCRARAVRRRAVGIDAAFVFPVGGERHAVAAGVVCDLQTVRLAGEQFEP